MSTVHVIADRQCYGIKTWCGRYGRYRARQPSSFGGQPIEYRGADGWPVFALDTRDADFASCKICNSLFLAYKRKVSENVG